MVQAADIGERALERAWERKFRATPATAPAKRPASMMDMDYEPGHKVRWHSCHATCDFTSLQFT